MSFLIFLAAAATAYFAWRIVDRLPDVVFRLKEIQRELSELRAQLGAGESESGDDGGEGAATDEAGG